MPIEKNRLAGDDTVEGRYGEKLDVEYIKPPIDPSALAGMRLGWPGMARSAFSELGKHVDAKRLMDIQNTRKTLEETGRIDMPAYMQKSFFNSLSPVDKLHYAFTWAPRGAPDTPLASPGFWAAASALSAPWAALGYYSQPVQDLLHGTPQQRRAKEGVPVLDDQPY